MNEFGSELMDTLIADAEEENIVEGKIIDQANIESTHEAYECPGEGCTDMHTYNSSKGVVVDNESKEVERSSDETARLDAQNEGFNSDHIS